MTDNIYPKIAARHVPPGSDPDFTVDREWLLRMRLDLDTSQIDGPTMTALMLWDIVAALAPEMDLVDEYMIRHAEAARVRMERAQFRAEIREVVNEVLTDRENG